MTKGQNARIVMSARCAAKAAVVSVGKVLIAMEHLNWGQVSLTVNILSGR
ncbi:MAG: hypothetical protein JRJ69_12440 [Deltaproteobacteria bacterium]|nr:hypothetical protein [Deltaproteobacteria bacterium]MBW1738326.1 hypothetical protein [Deltaproteobacteria bacterium]MBW1909988.1 hypothetical protein [Deltaproteobacteria bacterium]MBW2114349.1 hypothetical protein [Deltaproteobacteria bacterium]MBW2359205.1 hypothetical protein [Deltaproteobacteria bacterium]